MLGKGRAVELMDAIGAEVRKLIEPGAPAPDALRLERVADAIVSIEYYMETLQNGRTDPWYMLDNAEMCIKALAEESPSRVPEVELAGRRCRENRQARLRGDTRARARQARAGGRSPRAIASARSRRRSIRNSWSSSSRRPRRRLPRSNGASRYGIRIRWTWNRLGSLRRSFHTLKGSGRMVGARLIAEFALVDRESAEPHHRQDAVAHPGHDDLAAQRRRRPAAAGRAVGNRPTKSGAARCHHGARVCLRRRPRSRTVGRGAGAGGSRRRDRRGTGGLRAAAAEPAELRVASRQPVPPTAPCGIRPCRSRPAGRRPWTRSCMKFTARKPRAIWPRFATTCASAPASPHRMICRNPYTAPSTP